MIKKHTTPEMYETLQIVIQKWQDTDWARGAASLVLQELYKLPLDRVRPVIWNVGVTIDECRRKAFYLFL